MADSSRDMKSVEMFFKSLLLLQEDEFRQAVAADGRITNQLDEQLAELINNIEFESPFTFSLCLRIIERGMVDIMTFARLVDVSRCYSATQPNVHSLLQSWLLRCESWEAKSKQVVSFAMKKINRLEKRKVIQDTDLDFMIDTISVLKTIFNLNGSFIKENVQCCHAAYQLDTNSEKSRQLKSDILSFLHSMLSSLMQSPDVICEITLELLEENSGTSFMVDAPMVLDYEISFGFSEMLRSCQFSHTPRIEYLIMSLDHIVVLSGNAEKRRERAQALLSNLDTPPLHRDAENEMENIEIISKITALNDIFPDLGMGFLEAVLMDVEQDVELATMQILEKQFSPQVDRLDRQLARKFHILAVPAVAISGNLGNDSDDSSHTAVLEKDMLTERNNVFDGDEFDMMNGNVDMSLVHRGKANVTSQIEEETQSFVQSQKTKILQYDQYDDEYDDTYDSVDVNVDGFEDMGIKEVEASADISQKPLVECFKSNPSVFHISQRKSKARMDLLTKTKMSNEQVEGWYTMLLRNPLKDLILQKYEFSGNQKQPRTAPSWKVAPDAGSSRQDGGDGSPSIRGSSPRGRGKVNRSNARLKKMSKGR